MKKILIVLPILFLFLVGFILFDYIYYPIISYKAEKAAENYLEETYKEDFVIYESSYSKQLGEDWGHYYISAHPAKDQNVTVHLYVTDDMEPGSDDYLEMKWRAELNNQFASLYEELYESPENFSYMVNVTFPEDIYTKYNSSNTYQEIFEKEHAGIGNIIFANVFVNTSDTMDDQLEKAFTLIQHLNKQDLEYFSVYIKYFNESLKRELSDEDKKLDYSEFREKHLENSINVFSFDTRNEEKKRMLENLKTSADLKQYLQ